MAVPADAEGLVQDAEIKENNVKVTIEPTPVQTIDWSGCENQIDIKRDDMIPFSFGGNKVRIGYEYWKEARENGCDTMIAYGSSRSNMCRVIASFCKMSGMDCLVVSPAEEGGYESSANSRILESLHVPIVICQRQEIAVTLQKLMDGLWSEGKRPYYIYGDCTGHGTEETGNRAYEKAYLEIRKQEELQGAGYDYIFLASGTGATQAGLIRGQQQYGGNQTIVGISIARDRETGMAAIRSRLPESDWDKILFEDQYRGGGYGERKEEVSAVIRQMMEQNGIPMDSTYTGKAFWGMTEWLKNRKVTGARVLFLHTGGTPLYFDELYRQNGGF